MKYLSSMYRILVCGLVRNPSSSLASELQSLAEGLSEHGKVDIFLVESDSDDKGMSELKKLSQKLDSVSHLSLGRLEAIFPNRVERLAFCRNKYLELIPNRTEYDFMVVADMDSVNKDLSPRILKDLDLNWDFDALFANQAGPYYDLYALRHPFWCPNNVFLERDQLIGMGLSEREAGVVAIVSKMIRIPTTAAPIPVRSAFGGFAVYRVASIPAGAKYSAVDELGESTCEHVPFNEAIAKPGGKLYIQPSLVNANLTEHTFRVGGVSFILRWASWPIRSLLGFRSRISVI